MKTSSLFRSFLIVLTAGLGSTACSVIGEFPLTGFGEAVGLAGPREVVVKRVTLRAEYLDVELEGHNVARTRYLFPSGDEACSALLAPEASISLHRRGAWGLVSDGSIECAAVGIGSLAEWQHVRPRPLLAERKRSRADFRLIHADADHALVHGRFPSSRLIGWKRPDDTIALVPTNEVCQSILDRGVASLEYRPSALDPLVLIGEEGTCPVLALAIPSGRDRADRAAD